MNPRTFGPINVSGESNTVTLGDFGANAVVGTNATVISGPVDPQVLEAVRLNAQGLFQTLTKFADEQKLNQDQLGLLAKDVARIKQSVEREKPDEAEFDSAANSLWQKLMMFGKTAKGVSELCDGLKFIAGALGWKLSLPFL